MDADKQQGIEAGEAQHEVGARGWVVTELAVAGVEHIPSPETLVGQENPQQGIRTVNEPVPGDIPKEEVDQRVVGFIAQQDGGVEA